MKSLLIHLEDKDYEKLNKIKGSLTWKSFLVDMSNKKQIIEEIKEYDIEQVEKIADCKENKFFELIKKLTEK